MRRLMVKFILLFAIVGESSLIVIDFRPQALPQTESCSVVGVGSTAAALDATSGTVNVVPTTCEGLLTRADTLLVVGR